MAMDGGIAGLEQSQHHPLAGRSQYSPPSQTQANDSLASSPGDDGDLAASLIQRIKACVIHARREMSGEFDCQACGLFSSRGVNNGWPTVRFEQ